MSADEDNDFGAYKCSTCQDTGFRVYVDDGVSVSVAVAEANFIKGERRACPNCGGSKKATKRKESSAL
jgi:hypothetical protein